MKRLHYFDDMTIKRPAFQSPWNSNRIVS